MQFQFHFIFFNEIRVSLSLSLSFFGISMIQNDSTFILTSLLTLTLHINCPQYLEIWITFNSPPPNLPSSRKTKYRSSRYLSVEGCRLLNYVVLNLKSVLIFKRQRKWCTSLSTNCITRQRLLQLGTFWYFTIFVKRLYVLSRINNFA